MKTTIEMAREAAGDDWGLFQEYMPEIHRFEELVRADERKKIIAINAPEIERVNAYIKALEVAVEAEREQCAKVCETEWSNVAERIYGEECAAAIRARGSNT